MPQQQFQPQWMPKPGGGANCPPGLEYLTQVDQILVHQIIELLEGSDYIPSIPSDYMEVELLYFSSSDVIRDCQSLLCEELAGPASVFRVRRERSVCQAVLQGRERLRHAHRRQRQPGHFGTHHVERCKVSLNAFQEVVRIEREMKCCGGCNCFSCCDCCSMSIKVEAPPGVLVGSVEQSQSCLKPCFDVKDASGDTVLKIKGPACIVCPECCEVEFEVHILILNWKVSEIFEI